MFGELLMYRFSRCTSFLIHKRTCYDVKSLTCSSFKHFNPRNRILEIPIIIIYSSDKYIVSKMYPEITFKETRSIGEKVVFFKIENTVLN